MLRDGNREYQAASDTATRSRSGAFAYPVILAIIAFFTPFYHDHSFIITLIAVFIIVATIGRVTSAWLFEDLYRKSPRYWFMICAVSSLILSLSWGILCAVSIYYYEWQWTTMVACLSGAAFSAGAVVTFLIKLRLVIVYLIFMIGPVLIITLLMNTQESLTATFLFTTYLLFLINIAKKLNKEYWNALYNILLLNKRAMELQEKNEELESFSYSVSHDLRAPLRTIDGFCDILSVDAAEKLNNEEKEHFQRIRQAAQRMGAIIDDLLRLSKITRAEFKPGQINLSNLVQSNIEKVRKQYPANNVEVEIEPDVTIMGDYALLDVALENIISNAWKYSSKTEHPKIRFASSKVHGKTVFYIKDNGVGFDKRFYHKLFNPFQRLHHMNDFPGNGIGLATVNRVIKRHGGQVWANSKVNKGSTFYFTINDQVT